MSDSNYSDALRPNPFCMGEWVDLFPNGSDNGRCMVRRGDIESITRKPPLAVWRGDREITEHTVSVETRSGALHNVVFVGERAEGDAAALVEACLRRQTNPTRYSVSTKDHLGRLASELHTLSKGEALPPLTAKDNPPFAGRWIRQLAHAIASSKAFAIEVETAL